MESKLKLEEVGFYTLSEARCQNVSMESPLMRGELILTDKCNFKCPYCRGLKDDLKGDISMEKAVELIDLWAEEGLENIRFSGGEPTIYDGLECLVAYASLSGIKRIAVSTNGSADLDTYKGLIECGVNDFSISLDSCCASFNKKMTGEVDAFDTVTENIRALSALTYVSVGVVITEDNYADVPAIVEFAHNLGVADIRIIPSAQWDHMLAVAEEIPQSILDCHPILAYRVANIKAGIHVRGITDSDSHRCGLVLDDTMSAGGKFFPCVIYMREQGDAIGEIGPNMREQRLEWYRTHDTHCDPICKKNCLDVCILHNNRFEEYNGDKFVSKD